ncbi:protein shisa-5-like [Pseudorasbora parva]|uniref:protein shisa-5-like n=1 Tax=Pseudorasbora parva TaxID=51549 RepID=UPI00351E5124
MASSVVFLLFMSAGLFTVTVGFFENCKSYYTRSNVYKPSEQCSIWEHCCGTCKNRYCCANNNLKLSEDDQDLCNIRINVAGIAAGIVVTVVFCIGCAIFCCCCCPWCFIYKMRQRPRPVGTHVTTVMNAQSIQQPPVMQPVQYPAYQPVPTQPGYGGQPMQMGQTYVPGPAPPPPYQVAASPGNPSGQLPPETKQPAYNPAHLQPPNTGY